MIIIPANHVIILQMRIHHSYDCQAIIKSICIHDRPCLVSRPSPDNDNNTGQQSLYNTSTIMVMLIMLIMWSIGSTWTMFKLIVNLNINHRWKQSSINRWLTDVSVISDWWRSIKSSFNQPTILLPQMAISIFFLILLFLRVSSSFPLISWCFCYLIEQVIGAEYALIMNAPLRSDRIVNDSELEYMALSSQHITNKWSCQRGP